MQKETMPAMRDLRAVVADSLGCEAVYASNDAHIVRCIVERPSHHGLAFSEWLVALLVPREQRVASPPEPTESNAATHTIEDVLNSILHQNRRQHHAAIDTSSASAGGDVLDVLYTDIPRYDSQTIPHATILSALASKTAASNAPGLQTLRGVVTGKDVQELAVFDHEQQVLGDLFTFNRGRIESTEMKDERLADTKRRFIVFQLFDLLAFLHQNGLSGRTAIVPSGLAIAQGLYVRLGGIPIPLVPCDDALSSHTLGIPPTVEEMTTQSPTERWCRGDLSNFDYLMLLNAAAGRRMVDAVFHPVMPWVTDFSGPFTGWRDLTKSKYRLNKGDNQLDRTYETSVVPHHITESLSEITFYIYLARRTPMSVLRQVVRSNFQAKEYPTTIKRMVEWTPDECIPAFYSDPTVFASIHGDAVMADLELPSWCEDADDFIRIHREMLESPSVSSFLHRWIDLNFGVGLNGDEAVRNKNVPLQMQATTSTTTRKSTGFVQIFERSHPRRHERAQGRVDGSSRPPTMAMAKPSTDTTIQSAVKIANTALTRGWPPSPPRFSDSISPPTLPSSLVKLKKKTQKPRSNSQNPGETMTMAAASPTKEKDGLTASRSPKFARFANAIPKFFGAEAASPPVSGTLLSVGSSGATTSASYDATQGGDALASISQRSPTNHSHEVGGNSSHLFRDLWHQLSKPNENEHLVDHAESSTAATVSDPLDWSDADYDTLDVVSLRLLKAGSPINLLMEDTSPDLQTMPMIVSSAQGEGLKTVLDPVYEIPSCWVKVDASLPPRDVAIARDLFTLGCVIAETYLTTPLFSTASLDEYFQSFSEAASLTRPVAWSAQQSHLRARLRQVPISLQTVILGLVHPDPVRRLSTWRMYSPHPDPVGGRPSLDLGVHSFACAGSSLFPADFAIAASFLCEFHRCASWSQQFRVASDYLQKKLCGLPDHLFQLLVPVLTSFFEPRSHTMGINNHHVCAAVVFMLPALADRLGPRSSKIELLDHVTRLYEASDLSPILKMCLATPEHVKALTKAFGPSVMLGSVVPILLDWLASPPAYQGKKNVSVQQHSASPLFAIEAVSMVAVALGESASSDVFGPSIAVKYLLPSLLAHLGKVTTKWTRLADSPTTGTGTMNDGSIHATFVPKQVLYENHSIADAVLLVCRELPPSVVSENVLPHLITVIPRLVNVVEAISSARIEGVPKELALEMYVTLRVLRHVVRSLSEQAVEREFIHQRADVLVDLLNRIHPPFLHPRAIDAALTSVSESTVPATTVNARLPIARHHTAPPTGTAYRRSRLVIDHLMGIRGDKAQDLRAFTAVGCARTVTGIFQKVGATCTTSIAAAGIVQAVNGFLSRCATTYAELEVSDFQWRMASEVVTEFCSPLRALLGSAAFTRLFPIVQSSSVLQMLLLPPMTTKAVEQRDKPVPVVVDRSSVSHAGLEELVASHPQLLQAAYRSARIHGVKTTSFLYVSIKSSRMLSDDLNEEIFVAQEERRKRRAQATNNSGDATWLRPRVHDPFHSRSSDPPVATAHHEVLPLGSSWSLRGQVRHSLRAHTSATRSISIDTNKDLACTASKNGSCRVWRLSSYPSASVGTVNVDSSPLLFSQSLEDNQHAMAMGAAAVHVWDIRTSQVLFKVPFQDDRLHASTLLRLLPYREATGVRCEVMCRQSHGDLAVSSNRKVFVLDCRVPRVVADWRADAHDTTCITTTALIASATAPVGLLALGTVAGQVRLMDKRMGRLVSQWQAVESRVVKILQYTAVHVLVVGSDREARVWTVGKGDPTLAMVVTNVPDGVGANQISVQVYADMAVLYVAFSAKVYCCRLCDDTMEINQGRLESWSLMDNAVAGGGGLQGSPEQRQRLHRSKMVAQSIAVLPLRQGVLIGGDDGSLKSVV